MGSCRVVESMTDTAERGATHRGVVAAFVVDTVETLALGVIAAVSGSVAMRAQTAANAADVAVQGFLLIVEEWYTQ